MSRRPSRASHAAPVALGKSLVAVVAAAALAALLACPGAATAGPGASGPAVDEGRRVTLLPPPSRTPRVVGPGEPVTLEAPIPGPNGRTVRLQVDDGKWRTVKTRASRRHAARFTYRPAHTVEVRFVAPATRSGQRRWPKVVTAPAKVKVVQDAGPDPVRVGLGLVADGPLREGTPGTVTVTLPVDIAAGTVGVHHFTPGLGWGWAGVKQFDEEDAEVVLTLNAWVIRYGRLPLRAVVAGPSGDVKDNEVVSATVLVDAYAPNGGVMDPNTVAGPPAFLSGNGKTLWTTLTGFATHDDPLGAPRTGVHRVDPAVEALPGFVTAGSVIDASENGRYLLLASDGPLADGCANPELELHDTTTGQTVHVTTAPDQGRRCPSLGVPPPSVSESGAVFFYSFTVDGDQPAGAPSWAVYLWQPGERYAEQFGTYIVGHGMSGDGNRIAVATVDGNQDQHIVVEDRTTGALFAFDDVAGAARSGQPAWFEAMSDDGRVALMTVRTAQAGQDGDLETLLWDLDAATLTRVWGPGAEYTEPLLSGDGSTVAWQEGREFWVHDIATGQDRTVAVPNPGPCPLYGLRDLSFAGTVIAYVIGYSAFGDCAWAQNFELMTAPTG